MGSGWFKIARRSAGKLEIEFAGELTDAVVRACDADLRAQLSAAKAAAIKATIDLRDIEAYALEARDALVALQRFLGTKTNQTAFIASTAASRGLALWVMHTTEGQVIKTFAQPDDAEGWLTGALGPTTGVRPVVPTDHEARRRRPARSRKVAG
jgi:hypothetical protein